MFLANDNGITSFSVTVYQGNMRHWLEDPDCRDQYSVIYESGERTAIFSNDPKEPILVEERAVSTFPLKQTCFRVILVLFIYY